MYRGGDIAKMELNTIERTLQFYINNEIQGIVYNDIEFDDEYDYHLAICLCAYHTADQNCVELVDFKSS